MIVILAAVALLFVLLYFLSQQRRHDEFASRRQRYRESRLHAQPPQSPDPNFQFDDPATTDEKDKPGKPT